MTEPSNLDNSQEITEDKNLTYKRKREVIFLILCVSITLIFFLSIFILSLNRPINNFPVGISFEISEGETASDTAFYLENQGFIRSGFYLKWLLRTQYKNAYIKAGEYTFDKPLDINEIARAITSGAYASPLVSLTFYEGSRGDQIIEVLQNSLRDTENNFRAELFDEHIGYLFPDTYFVPSKVTAKELIALMQDTFDQKTKYLEPEIKASGLTKEQVVILASILEREANTEESMRIISGILERRLEIGMPLQVDATFEYLLGKGSNELTDEDLAIDSAFNTYTHKGLPPTPIANPGLTALEAVLDPINTDYLYYITDTDGNFHYAETFEEHKENKEKYLR